MFTVWLVEPALISPPVKLNLLLPQGRARQEQMYTARTATPIIMLLPAVLLYVLQDLIEWLPNRMEAMAQDCWIVVGCGSVR